MANCFFCQKSLEFEGRISFNEECPHCRSDVHVCQNCRFHDTGYNNECREPRAEMVRDRDRRNLCEYFEPGAQTGLARDEAAKAKQQLDNLFKKK